MSAITDFVAQNVWMWPLVSALVTLVFGALAKSGNPTVKAVFDVFSALGIDAPKLIAALRSLFAKEPAVVKCYMPYLGQHRAIRGAVCELPYGHEGQHQQKGAHWDDVAKKDPPSLTLRAGSATVGGAAPSSDVFVRQPFRMSVDS